MCGGSRTRRDTRGFENTENTEKKHWKHFGTTWKNKNNRHWSLLRRVSKPLFGLYGIVVSSSDRGFVVVLYARWSQKKSRNGGESLSWFEDLWGAGQWFSFCRLLSRMLDKCSRGKWPTEPKISNIFGCDNFENGVNFEKTRKEIIGKGIWTARNHFRQS